MKNGKFMQFPESEIEALLLRLSQGLPIYTTRVSDEYGKYKEGEIVETNLGVHLKVGKILKIDDIKIHPFLNEIGANQIAEITKYKPPYDLIRLHEARIQELTLK